MIGQTFMLCPIFFVAIVGIFLLKKDGRVSQFRNFLLSLFYGKV